MLGDRIKKLFSDDAASTHSDDMDSVVMEHKRELDKLMDGGGCCGAATSAEELREE